MKERLTTDNPITNTGTMLNLAYAKDGNVYLRCGVDDINLCDYVSDLAIKKGCNNTSKEIMEGACLECECEVNLLYCLGVQAAELRERLKYYEDLEETGQLIIPPCKVGDWIWYVYRNEINKAKVEEINYDASKHGHYSYNFSIYAYDFKNKREVTYHPINKTQKNKSNINCVEGMDFGEDVYVFLTREEAEKTLAEEPRERRKQ